MARRKSSVVANDTNLVNPAVVVDLPVQPVTPEVKPVEVATNGTPVAAVKLAPLPKLKKARKPKPAQSCACGCTGQTRGGRFIPGHDMRLKGILKRLEVGVMEFDKLDASVQTAVLAAGFVREAPAAK